MPKIQNKNSKRINPSAFLLDFAVWFYLSLVLYKVVYVRLILEERYPEFLWSQVGYTALAGFFLASLFSVIPHCSIGKRATGVDSPLEDSPFFLRPYNLLGLLTLVLTFVAGLHITQVSVSEFFSAEGLGQAKRIFTSLLTPNMAIFEEAIFAAIETIYMAFIATIFSLPFAFLLSFFAARNLMIHNRFFFGVYTFARFVLNITRSIEPLVWAIIFSVWVGIGPFAGMLALLLHSIASLAKLYSEQIENINDGPIEAMTATGAHPIQVVWYGVVPQIVLPFLSFTIYRWDINVRMATIIGLVGGGGIGTMLMQYQGLAKWNEVGLLVIVIATIVWVMDYASAKIREAIK